MTREKIQERLNLYYAAEAAILAGAQGYEIDGEIFTYADLKVITRQINILLHQLSAAQSGTGGIRRHRVVL
ncbi:hypothetical protein [Desulfoluna butyratoxydans]|uniref:Uncharacterized protein n=1 Tax=Desulfoluna butyratoxydans TaxID=231438 RepID=A0A4U8YKJ0_9BACT|nr:hypothetical protein [Desulfoluna butyratoxydans]VFQ44395.1 hypothetical protein MSL71_20440 [Desulfoluna butyratoxydans]